MATQYYDFYQYFRRDGKILSMPFIKLSEKSTDKYEIYRQGHTRFDNLSLKYYGSPLFDRLIKMANPEYGGMEFDIPDQSVIRIPFPLKTTIEEYISNVQKFDQFYGI